MCGVLTSRPQCFQRNGGLWWSRKHFNLNCDIALTLETLPLSWALGLLAPVRNLWCRYTTFAKAEVTICNWSEIKVEHNLSWLWQFADDGHREEAIICKETRGLDVLGSNRIDCNVTGIPLTDDEQQTTTHTNTSFPLTTHSNTASVTPVMRDLGPAIYRSPAP
jgi:hypothetical protein